MTSQQYHSVESAHRRFMTKFEYTKSIISWMENAFGNRFGYMVSEFDILMNEYILSVSPILAQIRSFSAPCNVVAEQDTVDMLNSLDMVPDDEISCDAGCFTAPTNVTENYHLVLDRESFIPRINNLLRCFRGICARAKNNAEVLSLLAKAEGTQIDTMVVSIEYDVCDCGLTMTVMPVLSELHCSCGIVKRIEGAVFFDEQFYPQDGQKTKHGDYEPNRHFNYWRECILGNANITIDRDIIAKINAVRVRDGVHLYDFKCEEARKCLKELGLTKLNDYTTNIIKLCGGQPPPDFTYDEICDISHKFNKILELYLIVEPNRKNKPYYTYFIYKIMQCKFTGNPTKLQILHYIHLQSETTTRKNDDLFRQICDKLPDEDGLWYTPTNRVSRV